MGRHAAEIVEFWRFLFRRFLDDRGISNAAALTYTTLFAVVPVMTVTFTMLSTVPAFQGIGEQIQTFIFRTFVPATGETVQSYLHGFTTQARQLTWVGVLLLAVTAFAMLVTVEKTFNSIWRVRQPRRGLSSFLLYWAVLSLGPLLLGAGFLVSTYIRSLALISGPEALFGMKPLLGFMPLITSMAAFTLLYASVPNARVPLRHALIGGAFTAVLLEVAKGMFGLYVGLFPGYQLIYGAFATVPLFLLWIYVSWVIVLFGAELVCNLSYNSHWRRRALPPLLVALGILRLFHRSQRHGLSLGHAQVQRAGWLLPEEEWNEILDFFERERLICRTGHGNWALCRDLSGYSLQRLFDHSPWPQPRLDQLPGSLPGEPWYDDLREVLGQLQVRKAELLGGDLSDWLQSGKADN